MTILQRIAIMAMLSLIFAAQLGHPSQVGRTFGMLAFCAAGFFFLRHK